MKRVPHAPHGGEGVARCNGGRQYRGPDSLRKEPVLRSRVLRPLLRSAAAGATRAGAMALESTLTAVILFLLHSL
ncbi:hypothetical protein A6A06_15235 [Streptomyces sp. CB02923]|uniref:hypothetical protein n=1 Tax=Streptomyces sp. CB02923 TaxID=1718985 RepID=UPI00093F17FE|nr:hypothetical protein [Streptomyces sp. CB02923]OKI02393.1 hypothetical protein A6A06_15235 [Streptomyces sp. CB02923]